MRTAPAIWLTLSLAPAAAMAQPAALVLEVSGGISPPVAAFDEIEAGTRLVLDAGATLALEHYAACEAARLSGGSVTVGAAGLAVGDGAVVERRPVECATPIALEEDTANAGVILRGLRGGPVSVALAPAIVIAGGAAGADRLRIERDGRAVATLPVRGGRVDWPQGGLFLSDGVRYRLVLAGGPGERSVEVIASRDGPGRVVLRPSAD